MALAGSQSSGPTRSSRSDEGQAPPRRADAAVEDEQRVRRVRDILGALGAESRIDVRVTARHTRTRQGVLGSATIWIAREDADDPDPERLRGLLGHEYAHVIDAHRRRDRALTSGAVVLAPLAMVAMPSAPQVLTAIVCAWCLALSVAFMACVSRRAEYRADAGAAELLGNPTPVVAMLQRGDADAKPAVATLVHRWMGALTHPAPERRIARLAGGTPRAP